MFPALLPITDIAPKSALGSFVTGGSRAIRIPRPRSPERPSSHPEATMDRCIAVTHAAEPKSRHQLQCLKGKGRELFAPALVPQVTREAQASYSVETSLPV